MGFYPLWAVNGGCRPAPSCVDIKSAENKKREALLEAKEEILAERTNHEREVKEHRNV